MARLELEDIQGLVARGYGKLPSACFILLRIREAAGVREWLRGVLDDVTPASRSPDDRSMQVAFTYAGLEALGVDDQRLVGFSREFREGMTQPYRARFLGDRDGSSPSRWRWRGELRHDEGEPPPDPATLVHVLVMLYARDETELERHYRSQQAAFERGLVELMRLDTVTIEGRREHFGFADGIAQPIVEGLSKPNIPGNTLPDGEFVLGYANAYGKYPSTPTVRAVADPDGRLPVDVESPDMHDLGRNGTYLVFRQLSQDVHAFWSFVDQATRLADGTSDPAARVRMAAKMVGRWPSGAPLVRCPERDDPELGAEDAFGYRELDPWGYRCPVGAHIRRTNPRDSLDGGPEASTKVSNRHRLLRRGRSYGAPVAEVLDPEEILEADAEHDEVGLHFICLGTDIARQFEFVQHTWVDNPKFAGLYSDSDPLMGDHGDGGTFTIPGDPVRRRITGLKRFVHTRGGAYFFLPGLRALDYLAHTPPPES